MSSRFRTVDFRTNRVARVNRGIARLREARKLNKRQRMQVKRMIRGVQELKYKNYSDTGAISSTAAISGVLFDIAQGDTDQERNGDQFRWVKALNFRYTLAVSDTSNIVRIIILQWHPSVITAPTISDILLTGPSSNVDVYSNYNHDQRFNYKILFDRTHTLVGNGTAGTFPGTTSSIITRHTNISLKRARKRVQLIGGSVSGSNRLFMLFVSDSTLVNHPTISYSMKMYFTDS